ncbi:ABC transporter, ATP-binding protein [Filifactor alocis ATCC 35896]|jgi:ABC-type multidrug transport system, ATPase component|uniref:ABC transporter, ATP-binding protein n=1 Tax=Filifactor alocis (strain ATCC 35896 / CCUG 47790 / D40 B5) TaxID=546269 RepID=D6GTS1_FILAD|nr:ABC transporter ATP-binding protein [Filifactor alocis]EFE27592.1 ABC transporter, ATP-binding protein [Filifactor alocis ATCC 35896]
MQINDNLLEFINVTKKFSNKTALDNVSFAIQPGRIIGLLGSNGSGKSTSIKMINGLLQPDSGQVLIKGNTPSIESKKIISYLPERTYLNDWMTVSQILSFFEDFYEDFDSNRAKEMLTSLGIDENAKLKTLSKGTKEKVQLILVMSRKAELYVLDEPIGGVDPAARDYILSTIIQNYSESSSILISTHLIQDVEKILDDVILINNGQIYMTGSVDDIRSENGISIDNLFREVFRC